MLRYWGRILAMPAGRVPRAVYDAMRAEGHRASWTSVVHRLAYEWGLGDVWRQQKLPESAGNDDVGAWKARLRKLAKQRARVKLTGDLARRALESRVIASPDQRQSWPLRRKRTSVWQTRVTRKDPGGDAARAS